MPRFKYDKYHREQIRGEWLDEDKAIKWLKKEGQILICL